MSTMLTSLASNVARSIVSPCDVVNGIVSVTLPPVRSRSRAPQNGNAQREALLVEDLGHHPRRLGVHDVAVDLVVNRETHREARPPAFAVKLHELLLHDVGCASLDDAVQSLVNAPLVVEACASSEERPDVASLLGDVHRLSEKTSGLWERLVVGAHERPRLVDGQTEHDRDLVQSGAVDLGEVDVLRSLPG